MKTEIDYKETIIRYAGLIQNYYRDIQYLCVSKKGFYQAYTDLKYLLEYHIPSKYDPLKRLGLIPKTSERFFDSSVRNSKKLLFRIRKEIYKNLKAN